jgi:hypothetical protein
VSREVKSLTLVFPNGSTVKLCDKITQYAEKITGFRVSEGGFTVTRRSLTDDDMHFSEDEMTYVFGYEKEDGV